MFGFRFELDNDVFWQSRIGARGAMEAAMMKPQHDGELLQTLYGSTPPLRERKARF